MQQIIHPEIIRILYPFFRDAFDLYYVPSAETLQLYLERIAEGKDRILQKISKYNTKLLDMTKITSVDAVRKAEHKALMSHE